jgi:hypothetical protein
MTPKRIAILIFAVLTISCVKDVDFDQTRDIEFETVFQASVLHFNVTTSSFLDEFNNEVLFLSDTTELPIFSGSQNENYLKQVDFIYKIKNTFNRELSVQLEFLKVNNELVYIFDAMIIPSNMNDFQQTQTVFEENIPSIVQSEKVVINIIMQSSSQPLDLAQDMELDFQSATKFYYKVTIDE